MGFLSRITCALFGHRFNLKDNGRSRSCQRCGFAEFRCEECKGEGKILDPVKGDTCKLCKGKGRVFEQLTCPFDKCAGEGTMCSYRHYVRDFEEATCVRCRGSGREQWRRCVVCREKGWIFEKP